MLFNSYAFLLAYLPVTAVVFFLLARRSRELAAAWLAAASLVFYAWWSLAYLPLLLASIAFNFRAGQCIAAAEGRARRRWLTCAVAANLVVLAYFKYADFFLASVNALTGTDFPMLRVLLPIGISFFTFTQIAFLVDTAQGKVREFRFTHYLLFVTYFPHLVAGPVLHHKEMMPQFAEEATYRFSAQNLAVGLTIFIIGLAKKVLIADNLADHANFVFDKSDSASLLVAWGGVFAYAFQLYFDFSGYSDMAIGLSRIFGVRLPLNFNSPYKSASIVEFWRCWHMTLSRFLRDYLYIPLGGNQKGRVRRYANLMTTMTLGGLWHGASWNFVLWGALHGAYLMLNHAWATLAGESRFRRSHAWRAAGVLLTFAAVCVAWVFFRAADLPKALWILQGMAGLYGVSLPDAIGYQLGAAKPLLEQWGVTFYLGGGARFMQTWGWVACAAAIAFLLPNTQELMRRFEPALDFAAGAAQRMRGLAWQPSACWAAAVGVLAVFSLLSLNRPTEFLYFQF